MATMQATNSSSRANLNEDALLSAENELLRQKCARLDEQVMSPKPDIHTQVIDGLCNVFQNDLPRAELEMDDWGFETPSRPFSPLSFQRSLSSGSYCGSFDGNFFLDDASSFPTIYDVNLSEDDFMESVSLPRLGRSTSAGWQANVGTPRSGGLTTPSVPTDENKNANANAALPPPQNPLQKKKMAFQTKGNAPFGDMEFLNVDMQEHKHEQIDTASSASPTKSSSIPKFTKKILVESSPTKSALIPKATKKILVESPRTKREKIASNKLLESKPKDEVPRLSPVTPLVREAKENSSWDKVLSPEQRHKHENWVHKKRRRVKYGRSYVYTNKRDIAKGRTRCDGKFQKNMDTQLRTPSPPKKKKPATPYKRKRS
jgi:hypothetical protein